ncbi:MAG: ribonuclease domain-containing protein [Nocardioidaceae bacterium]
MKQQRAALGVVIAVVAAVIIWWSQGGTSPSQSAETNQAVTASQLPSPSGSVDAGSGLPWVAVSALPAQARQTLDLIGSGGPFPYSEDGETFHNYGDLLPDHPYGFYHEYTVVTPGSDDRGARRIIVGTDGACYYTSDHYNSFERISL